VSLNSSMSLARPNPMSLDKVIDSVKNHQEFFITTHMNPEADAIGSSLALAHLLRGLGKAATVVCHDPIPAILRFLPYSGVFRQADRLPAGAAVLFVLDCGDPGRTGLLEKGAPDGCLIINIDHHVTNKQFGAVNWVDHEAAATGELVHELLTAMGQPITPEIALCLYATLVTETGFFAYSNTRSKTLRLAASLLDEGVDPWAVAQRLRENTPERLLLLAELLHGINRSSDGRIAWMTVTRDMFKRTGTTAEDTDEMIGYPRSLKGVEIAILFREVDDSTVKVSMRSRNVADVAALANQFGGGGHTKAAGCTVKGTLPEVRKRMIDAAEDALRNAA
jgi:bifunctional oligoribonuclease and PAP phosphatase NrnA